MNNRSVKTMASKVGPDHFEKAVTELRTGLARFKAQHNLSVSNLAEIMGASPNVLAKWLATGKGGLNFNHLLRYRKCMNRIHRESLERTIQGFEALKKQSPV